MWKSSAETEHELRASPDLTGLVDAFSLSVFWRNAFYSRDYSASGEWLSILSFTPYGETIIRELRSSLHDIPEPDLVLSCFAQFYHHDLLVNCEGTDAPAIRRLLQNELLESKIRLPHRFGRALYDRFNDTYSGSRTDHLMSEDADRLLREAPIGVYQVGEFVSGPLGILDFLDSRFIPPSLSLPLWHCSDTGCKSLHDVSLHQPRVPVVEARSKIARALDGTFGPPSEWGEAFTWQLHKPEPRRYVDLPVLIADCIVGSDRAAVLEAALLSEHGQSLRNIMGTAPRRRRDAEGPAAELASRLDPEAQFQLLMTLPDRVLIDLVDDAAFSRTVRIPAGEIREAVSGSIGHDLDSACALSPLGLRSVSQPPVVNLTSSIWRAYEMLHLHNELEWRVRGDGSKSTYEALVAFVRNRGPAEAIRELILSSKSITATVCEEFNLQIK